MNLVIVEPNELVLQKLQHHIAAMKGIRISGHAPDEDSAVFMIGLAQPDFVLLDLALVAGTGLKVLKRIRAEGSQARVLVLTHHTADAVRKACAEFDIDGFYDKGSEVADCLNHLRGWVAA